MNTIIVVITSIIIMMITLPKVKPSLRLVFVFAFLLRLVVLYLDSYQILHIPFTGNDTEKFS